MTALVSLCLMHFLDVLLEGFIDLVLAVQGEWHLANRTVLHTVNLKQVWAYLCHSSNTSLAREILTVVSIESDLTPTVPFSSSTRNF